MNVKRPTQRQTATLTSIGVLLVAVVGAALQAQAGAPAQSGPELDVDAQCAEVAGHPPSCAIECRPYSDDQRKECQRDCREEQCGKICGDRSCPASCAQRGDAVRACSQNCEISLVPDRRALESCNQDCLGQTLADTTRCKEELAGSHVDENIVFRAGNTGWIAVPLSEPDVQEYPSRCAEQYGDQALTFPIEQKPGTVKCWVPYDPDVGAKFIEDTDTLAETDGHLPPSKRKGGAAIWAKAVKSPPRGLCPAGTSAELVANEIKCARIYGKAQLCAHGSYKDFGAVAGCGDVGCRIGEQDLGAASRGKISGCFTCPAGSLDLPETIRWRETPESVNGGALCKVDLRARDADQGKRLGALRLRRAQLIETGSVAAKKLLAEAGFAEVDDVKFAEGGSRELQPGGWPLVIDVRWTTAEGGDANAEAVRIAKVLGDAFPDASVLKLHAHLAGSAEDVFAGAIYGEAARGRGTLHGPVIKAASKK